MGPPLAAAGRQISPELLSCLHIRQHPSAHLETGQQSHVWTQRPTPLLCPILISQGVWLINLCPRLTNRRAPWVGQSFKLKKMCTTLVSQRKTRPQGEQLEPRFLRERKTPTWRLFSPLRSRTGAQLPRPPHQPHQEATLCPSPTWLHASPPWDKDQVRAATSQKQRSLWCFWVASYWNCVFNLTQLYPSEILVRVLI